MYSVYPVLFEISSFTHTYASRELISDLGLDSNCLQSVPCFESSDFHSRIPLSH